MLGCEVIPTWIVYVEGTEVLKFRDVIVHNKITLKLTV